MRGTARPRGRRVGPAPLPPRLLKGGGSGAGPRPALPCLALLCSALPRRQRGARQPPGTGEREWGTRTPAVREHLQSQFGCVSPPSRESGWGARTRRYGGAHRVRVPAGLEERLWDVCAHGCGGARRVRAALVVEQRVEYMHPRSRRTAQRLCRNRHGRAQVVQAHTVKENCLGWEHPSSVGAHIAPTAVEEYAGWEYPQLWRSLRAGSTRSCGGLRAMYAFPVSEGCAGWECPQPCRSMARASVAVEENAAWVHPQRWKSTCGARTPQHSCGGLYGVEAAVAVEEHRGSPQP